MKASPSLKERLERFLRGARGRFLRRSKRPKAIALGVALLLCFASGAVLASMRKAPASESMKEARAVKIGAAQPLGASRFGSYPGTARAFTKVNLFFRVGGPIVETAFQIGDKVRAGQVLMRIDPRDFERKVETLERQVAQEAARLAAMKSGDRPEDKEIASKELAAATARFDKATFDFKRAEKLYGADVFSKAQYDEAKSSFVVAESEFAAYKQRLAKSNIGSRQEDIDAQEASLAAVKTQLKIAEDALSDSVLRAPFDGIVTKRFLESHEMAQAFAPVLTMQDIDTVKIDVDVPESGLLSLDGLRGRKFQVSFNSRPGKPCEAVLEEYSADANAAGRTYTLTVRMRQPGDFTVLPGMTAEVSGDFISGSAGPEPEGALVPSSAVVRKPGLDKDLVWVLGADGRSVARREVKPLGLAGSDMMRVEGLSPGARVVVAGGSFLEDGMSVRQIDFHKGAGSK